MASARAQSLSRKLCRRCSPLNCTGKSAPGAPVAGGSGATDMHCTLGVASRDGWAVVDDTLNAVVTGDDWIAMNPSGDAAGNEAGAFSFPLRPAFPASGSFYFSLRVVRGPTPWPWPRARS